MEQISASTGIKVGQIYRDFDGKDSIIAEIVHAELTEILDEASFERAIGDDDTDSVRFWITRFMLRSDPSKDRLVAEIIAEASRNERIAALFQQADCRIRQSLTRAISVFAPCATARECARLAELTITLRLGLAQRHMAAPDTDPTALAGDFIELIKGQLDRLAGTAGLP